MLFSLPLPSVCSFVPFLIWFLSSLVIIIFRFIVIVEMGNRKDMGIDVW